MITPLLTGSLVLFYFLILLFISNSSSKQDENSTFFNANKNAPWYLVAFGMIGASLSGVTFISVPGWVGDSNFGYFQTVLGYLLGYVFIAGVLLPLYYRYKLTSIYAYLDQRFGNNSYKTGAAFFLMSRIIGASMRLYLVAAVLDFALFKPLGIPYWIAVLITIALIYFYTYKSGIKTIVFTDALQTLFMLLAVIFTVYILYQNIYTTQSFTETIINSNYSQIFHWDFASNNNFFKQFLGGALIAITMTGMDQDMMQKNLSIRTLKDSQKNMFWFCIVLVFANLLFLSLGALLYIYADKMLIPMPEKSDMLFPTIALEYLPVGVSIFFIIGLIAAAFSSADSALTSLTTSFCIDFLGFEKKEQQSNSEIDTESNSDSIDTFSKVYNAHKLKKTRKLVHLSFAVILFVAIMVVKLMNNDAIIKELFTVAGYTYGPILGLFTFGIMTKRKIKDNLAPVVCILAIIMTYIIDTNSVKWFYGFELGFLVLLINGLLTFVGLNFIKTKSIKYNDNNV